MEGKETGATVGDGGGVLVSKPSASSRPTLSLPLRSSVESLFKGTDASPGPMTLVSSFFSEYDPDSDCRSFSQLLAGAMASPNAQPPLMTSNSQSTSFDFDRNAPQGGTSNARFRTMPPTRIPITIPRSPYFTVPAGLSPTTLLDSPVLLSATQRASRPSWPMMLQWSWQVFST